MHIQDLEKEEVDKATRLKQRRKDGYGVDSDTDSDDEGAASRTKGQTAHQLRKILKSQKASRGASTFEPKAASRSTFKQAGRAAKLGRSGHIVKHSGDRYVGKGKGDVLKAGEHEPFSYIQLNPRLLNKRHRQ